MIGSVPDMFVRSKSSAASAEMGAEGGGTRAVARAEVDPSATRARSRHFGRVTVLALALTAAQAQTEPSPDTPMDEAHARDAAQVVRLNDAVRQRNDDIARQNAAAQAAYARDRAAYEAARLQNDRAQADAAAAADAYRGRQADYEASLARWREGEARRSSGERPAQVDRSDQRTARGDRIVCKQVLWVDSTGCQASISRL